MVDFAAPRTIVITGASRGIGEALALAYSAPGVRLGLVGRNETRLASVAEACRAKGAEVEAKALDVTDRDALHAWLDAFDEAWPIDLVIANAGVNAGLSPQGAQESWQDVRRVIDVNVYGVFNTLERAVERMRARKKGQVAVISSIAGYYGLPGSPSYCASKAAVMAYGEAMRGWLSPMGIGVTVVCPGYVQTDMSDRVAGAKPLMMSPEKAARVIQNGLARNKGHIAFPKSLAFGARLLRFLPGWAVDRVLPLFAFTVRAERD